MDTVGKTTKDIKTIVINILSLMLGVEPGDLHQEDLLSEDLHMGPADLTDMTERLADAGFNITKLNFEEIETIGELIDHLSSEEEI